MNDDLLVALISAGCSGAIGVAGVVLLRLLRPRSLRVSLAVLAATAVLAVVAAVIGAAQAMLISPHDLRVVLLATAIAGTVALAVSLLLAREVVRGSRALVEATRALGDGGRAGVPAPPATRELAALSAELEATSSRLEQAREREQALESSRRELVAWVSHDLRTPLAGLRAMAEALEDGMAEDPARYHRQIGAEVDHLASLVDDLFELSRIQSGTLRLALDSVSLSEVVAGVLVTAEPLARARSVRLAVQTPAAVPVRGDSGELARAVINLVGNAIRHTPSDGTVLVRTAPEDGAAVLEVSDRCGGIPAEDLDRVFDVAWRGSHARTPGSDGGGGLGLAIVRGIVEAHAGTVTVANTTGGCRFQIRLPLLPTALN